MKKIIFLSFILATIVCRAEYYEIKIPTRLESDGHKYLNADFYSWDSSKAKPVILIQTPYNKEYYRLATENSELLRFSKTFFDTLNYHYVIADWRGFYSNKEADSIGYDRGLDGYDIVEWIAGQSWSNGKIGTLGTSALGMIQYQTARHRPPHLVCCCIIAKGFQTKYESYYYGGALRLEQTEQRMKLGFLNTEIITSLPIYNNIWRSIENNSDYPEDFGVPMLLISGWYDHFPGEVIESFDKIKRRSDEEVRAKHKLIMGPWLHSSMGELKQGELEYPLAEGVPLDNFRRFFGFYLLGWEIAWESMPAVNYYEAGGEKWHTADDWYGIPRDRDTLYIWYDGKLETTPLPPTFKEVDPDTIKYDPRDPSPSYGGCRFNPFVEDLPMGPMDTRAVVESRNDCLIYETESLESALAVNGKIIFELFVSSDRFDTDISVRLCDVFPDGRSMIITQGIKRLRFRDSVSFPNLLEPGIIYEVHVELEELSYCFEKDHKLKIIVTSSNYPMFDRNLNNGEVMYVAGDTLIATNLLYHDQSHNSKIILPVPKVSDVSDLKTAEKDWLIFPNPSDGSFEIKHPQDEAVLGIEVIDIYGRKVYSSSVWDNNRQIVIGNVNSGVYIIKIQTREGYTAKKIIISQ